MSVQGIKRLQREYKTIEAMTQMYCKKNHSEGLCQNCRDFLQYAQIRLEKCPYQSLKPPCSECPVHCYQAEWRERARQIMKDSGPGMLASHPILTLLHFWDQWRSQARLQKFKSKKK